MREIDSTTLYPKPLLFEVHLFPRQIFVQFRREESFRFKFEQDAVIMIETSCFSDRPLLT